MPFNLAAYLRDQSIRLRREKQWPATNILSDEIYTILSNILVEETGPISVTPIDGGDPIELPGIDDLPIPPIDLIPGGDPNLPEIEENDPTYTRSVTYFPNRAVFPGQVQSHRSGAEYNVRIYPNGNLVLNGDSSVVTQDIVASVTDESLAGTVAPNAWVYVFWIAEYRFTTETFRSELGESLGTTSDLQVAQEEFLFIAPTSGGGGKVARVTATITGRVGLVPGVGRAILYDFNLGGEVDPETGEISSPILTDGAEVDVYNSVSSEIQAGEDGIQVKRIDNAWFIDVQDCGAAEEEE